MINPLRSIEDYELFLYTIVEKFSSVKHSTLTFVRLGATLARVSGELLFENNIRLVIRERILYDRLPAMIDWYGYEIWQRDKRLFWYDSQPHPNDPNLQSTQPHHKHIYPNIKHNRIPASNMSFIRPNITNLIQEIETIVETKNRK
jgi:hypothetical protein